MSFTLRDTVLSTCSPVCHVYSHNVCLDLLLPLLKHSEEWRWKNRKRGELSHICDCEHAAAEKMTEGYRTLRYQKTQEPNSVLIF